ncbi:MAG: cation:proton antiporter [Streptosporangiales bacterium]
MHSVEIVLGLVVLGTVVAAFANRLRIPAPSLLVVAGVAIGLIPGVPAVRVASDVVSFVVLPPLLWAATDELPWRDLKAVWRQVAVLAVGLVLASAAAVAAVVTAVAAVPLTMAFVLGAGLASTDPVAVSALGRRLSLPPRVQAVVQGESLFNDATSLVLFQIAVSFAVGGAAAAGPGGAVLRGAIQFLVLAGGGALAGAVVAAGVIGVRSLITDPVLESAVALITPYVAYVLGEAAHVSGVMAVIVAGLAIGLRHGRISTAQTRLQIRSVYQTEVFLLESVVFSLIGLELPTLVRDLPNEGRWPLAALAVSGTLLATRILWVFPLWAVTRRRGGTGRPPWTVPAVVSWAGTRGVVPLAAALSIPLTTATGAPMPQRALVLVLTVVVIVISLCVQGLTLDPLVRWRGVGPAGRQHPAGGGHRPAAAGRGGHRPPRRAGGRRGDPGAGDRPDAPGAERAHRARARGRGRRRPRAGRRADRARDPPRRDRRGERRAVPAVRRRHDQRHRPQRLQRQLDLELARFSDEPH